MKYRTKEAALYLKERGYTVKRRRVGGEGPPTADTLKHWCIARRFPGAYKEGSGNRATWYIPQEDLDRLIRGNTMATYEMRATGVEGQTEVLVRTGIARVPEGWNMTPEKAATYPFIAGYVNRDGSQWHATSMAAQAFRRPEWTQNEGRDFETEQEALDWVVARCDEEMAGL